ncbi:MAG: hypothetical protein IKP88_00845 [Lachnospiraceae bacterium]|nr:hypothetical protein [Lachnospiraceae bacterium]
MMKYLINMLWPDGTETILDEEFDTEEEATEVGCYTCGCFSQGNEILEMGGHDYMEGQADFEILEVEED